MDDKETAVDMVTGCVLSHDNCAAGKFRQDLGPQGLTFGKSNYPHCFYNSTRCYPAFAAVKSFVLNDFLISYEYLKVLSFAHYLLLF